MEECPAFARPPVQVPRMSLRPSTCPDCGLEGRYTGVARRPDAPPESSDYAVSWQCPACQRTVQEVCPFGPLVPDAAHCLNCGADYPTGVAYPSCPDCHRTRWAVETLLEVPDELPPEPVAAAR